jgi:hypothetical protein
MKIAFNRSPKQLVAFRTHTSHIIILLFLTMRFLFGLACVVVTASGFAPVVHRSLSVARVGSEKTTMALFSAVPKQRGGGDGFRKAQVSKDGLEHPEVPAFVNGVVVVS